MENEIFHCDIQYFYYFYHYDNSFIEKAPQTSPGVINIYSVFEVMYTNKL